MACDINQGNGLVAWRWQRDGHRRDAARIGKGFPGGDIMVGIREMLLGLVKGFSGGDPCSLCSSFFQFYSNLVSLITIKMMRQLHKDIVVSPN